MTPITGIAASLSTALSEFRQPPKSVPEQQPSDGNNEAGQLRAEGGIELSCRTVNAKEIHIAVA
jgi:hypothetical protein